jgi:hypothetical protein
MRPPISNKSHFEAFIAANIKAEQRKPLTRQSQILQGQRLRLGPQYRDEQRAATAAHRSADALALLTLSWSHFAAQNRHIVNTTPHSQAHKHKTNAPGNPRSSRVSGFGLGPGVVKGGKLLLLHIVTRMPLHPSNFPGGIVSHITAEYWTKHPQSEAQKH